MNDLLLIFPINWVILKSMKIVIGTIVLSFVFSSIFLLSGCMTSKGTLFQDVVSTDSDTTENDYGKEKPGLTIRTSPYWSDVYINDNYSGISSVTKLLPSGSYRITVKKEGYYPTTEWVNYIENDSVTLDIDLEPITGILEIETDNSGINLSTNGDTLNLGQNELQIGNYIITAEQFGFETLEKKVTILEDRTTNLDISLKPAIFKISSFFVDRKIFNPENTASLGESRLSFKVTNFGSGDLEIFSPEGESILKHNFQSFSKKDQYFSWNGKNRHGENLSDGTYKIVIKGKDLNGENSAKKETLVTIDRSLHIRVRSIFNGVSGTLFSPSPDILPPGSFQLSLNGLGHIDSTSENYRFPIILGIRTVPVKDMEISGQAGGIIQEPLAESYIFSVSVKKAILPSRNYKPFELTGTLKGTYLYNTFRDTQTNFTGLSGGLSSSVSVGTMAFILAPEITISPYEISYSDTSNRGFYMWAYGRTAVLLDLGSAMIGISAAFRTTSFDEGFTIEYPFSTGVELNYLIPGTGMFVTGIVSGEFNSPDNYYINAGGGIGIIN